MIPNVDFFDFGFFVIWQSSLKHIVNFKSAKLFKRFSFAIPLPTKIFPQIEPVVFILLFPNISHVFTPTVIWILC